MQQRIRQPVSGRVRTVMQSPPRSGRRGHQPPDDGEPETYCNPFLLWRTLQPEGPSTPRRRPDVRRRRRPDVLFGVLDQAEIADDGSAVLMFGTVEGVGFRPSLDRALRCRPTRPEVRSSTRRYPYTCSKSGSTGWSDGNRRLDACPGIGRWSAS